MGPLSLWAGLQNLAQLNVSYVDLVLIHKPCATVAQNNALWKGLMDGKVRALPQPSNKNCTGLAQIVGQVQASDRDFQSKHWAKSRNLGQPCETHLLGVRALLTVRAPDRGADARHRRFELQAGPGPPGAVKRS